MTEPLRPGDPAVLGRYWVDERLREMRGGTVFLGRAPSGEIVSLAVLSPATVEDPMARARLREVLASWPPDAPRILAADVWAALPWVVTPYRPCAGRRGDAGRVLDAVVPEPPPVSAVPGSRLPSEGRDLPHERRAEGTRRHIPGF